MEWKQRKQNLLEFSVGNEKRLKQYTLTEISIQYKWYLNDQCFSLRMNFLNGDRGSCG